MFTSVKDHTILVRRKYPLHSGVTMVFSQMLTAIIESRTYKIESNRIILKNIFIFAKWKTMFTTSKLTSIGN